MKLVVAFTGHSGSGKTTLIEALIPRLKSEGQSVAVVKHTHHPLNEENRGDTGRFIAAGAAPVLLARERDAVVFDPVAAPRRIAVVNEAGFVDFCDTDVVLVEGFKQVGDWPKIWLDPSNRLTPDEALAILGRIRTS